MVRFASAQGGDNQRAEIYTANPQYPSIHLLSPRPRGFGYKKEPAIVTAMNASAIMRPTVNEYGRYKIRDAWPPITNGVKVMIESAIATPQQIRDQNDRWW